MLPKHHKASFFLNAGLFDNLSNFAELEDRISKLPTTVEVGDAFEVFAEAYFFTQKIEQAEEVWPFKSVPASIKLDLSLGTNQQDMGVDGVYKTASGTFNAYQATFRTGRSSLTWRDLSTFMGLTDNVSQRVLFTNSNDMPSVINDRTGFHCIRGNDLDRLDKNDFDTILKWLQSGEVEVERKITLHHQDEAIEDIITTLKDIVMREKNWEEKLESLKEYKKNYGDCNVPAEWSDKLLINGVSVQRTKCENIKLRKDYIKGREDIKFIWNKNEINWEYRFAELKEYNKIHGTCNIPNNLTERKLLSWVNTQRTNYKIGKLRDDRIKRLEKLGFIWKPTYSKQDEWFDALKDYKNKHGNCNVPHALEEYKQLYQWVMAQRNKYKKGKLSNTYIKLLEDIGFDWNINN